MVLRGALHWNSLSNFQLRMLGLHVSSSQAKKAQPTQEKTGEIELRSFHLQERSSFCLSPVIVKTSPQTITSYHTHGQTDRQTKLLQMVKLMFILFKAIEIRVLRNLIAAHNYDSVTSIRHCEAPFYRRKMYQAGGSTKRSKLKSLVNQITGGAAAGEHELACLPLRPQTCALSHAHLEKDR